MPGRNAAPLVTEPQEIQGFEAPPRKLPRGFDLLCFGHVLDKYRQGALCNLPPSACAGNSVLARTWFTSRVFVDEMLFWRERWLLK